MTTLVPVSKPISQLHLAPGSKVTIPDVSWAEFEAILQELGERRAARIAYSLNVLEIAVPLPEHEVPTDLISDIVKLLLRMTGRRYQPFGSTTFKQPGVAGVEPDACFYIHNYERMIGRRKLQPGDPPPDLAIETDVTSLTTITAYRAIAVPEVWIYADGKLTLYLLQAGDYVASDTSPLFPHFPIAGWVEQAVSRAWTVGSLQALEELEASVTQFQEKSSTP
ncbi:Uma2 family endonuclease [Nodosilinea sp. LEGE 06152]|uniref:Uma2 family endonuclease n=1 Tax=Nodosilinea sp. LEGE 06152 TaxID=2777966 RepID=UPI00187FBA75|nr:Uma2 family endonuclease [Nodosilinea sp. LEGE 06152]MBE9157938.1 Uma2 family endonuclease [Nodosilinea sp. LEGE 06152]